MNVILWFIIGCVVYSIYNFLKRSLIFYILRYFNFLFMKNNLLVFFYYNILCKCDVSKNLFWNFELLFFFDIIIGVVLWLCDWFDDVEVNRI